MFDGVFVKGAFEHNLKHIDFKVPRNKITVVTGLSGSGKSSIAFDTIYAEGQRRYIESLSSYARQFLNPLKKPDMQSISGLSPAIAIDQKSIGVSPRSTVGTITEIYDFMRLLYARVGVPHCPVHNKPVVNQTPQQIVAEVLRLKPGTKYLILAPMAQDKKGEFNREFEKWAKRGFVRARVDGEWVELATAQRLAKHKRHNVELLIDRLIVEDKFVPRLKEAINASLSLAKGMVTIEAVGEPAKTYSIHATCSECGYSFPELEPRHFSFNNPRGACEECNGLGVIEQEWEVETEDGEEEIEIEEAQCATCHGQRLNQQALNVFFKEKNIAQLNDLSAEELLEFLQNHPVENNQKIVTDKILAQIISRLEYVVDVGTGYLSMGRRSRTLSGGESQRLRLATQVGSSLIGVLYILDEPSIGLHPRDHAKLLGIIGQIKDRGNTILMVEHDEDTIRGADYVIDMGPRAGRLGGEIIAEGTPADLENNVNSITGQYLSGKLKIKVPKTKRIGNGQFLELKGACGNNLKDVNIKIPLGTFVGVTGVSGSGKSTLIRETLYRRLAQDLYKNSHSPAPHKGLVGVDEIDKVIEISQRPIGKTPRSTPATYTGLFPLIRGLFSSISESKIRGFKPGHFSFNVKGGRCEKCQGAGRVKLEMHFLADVYVECDDCLGRRYNRDVLNIRFRGKNIADVLEMTVEEAHLFFTNHKHIARKLETLMQVGLDYMTLGQNSKTLSGGEAQRVKLSKELSKRGTGRTLYILDEPTTGLHFSDIDKLVELLQSLVDQGNTVLVIEHNMDVIKCCDHVIDMGPEGGIRGGYLVFEGPPEKLALNKESLTGPYLSELL